jgi:RluA family pseudouridine synthase
MVQKVKEIKLFPKEECSLEDFILSELDKKFSLTPRLNDLKNLFQNEKVRLNGRVISDRNIPLKKGQKVSISLTKSQMRDFSKEIEESIELSEDSILFEDSSIIIVDKPSGISSNATTDSSKDHLLAALKRFRPKEKYISLHHRLDLETSGLLLFCKKKSLNKAISDMFEKRNIEKTYFAIVEKREQEFKESIKIDNLLTKDEKNRMKMKSTPSEGKKAITHFGREKEENGFYLIKASPKTGRMHQIRVHLSELGFPIVGDSIYGGSNKGLRTLLHAYSLEFNHPKTQKKMKVISPLPEDFFITN